MLTSFPTHNFKLLAKHKNRVFHDSRKRWIFISSCLKILTLLVHFNKTGINKLQNWEINEFFTKIMKKYILFLGTIDPFAEATRTTVAPSAEKTGPCKGLKGRDYKKCLKKVSYIFY